MAAFMSEVGFVRMGVVELVGVRGVDAHVDVGVGQQRGVDGEQQQQFGGVEGQLVVRVFVLLLTEVVVLSQLQFSDRLVRGVGLLAVDPRGEHGNSQQQCYKS